MAMKAIQKNVEEKRGNTAFQMTSRKSKYMKRQ
jgi:hypothetical protein